MTKREYGINKINELFLNFKKKEIKKSSDEIFNDAYMIASIEEFVCMLENKNTSSSDFLLSQFAENKLRLEDFWDFYMHTELSIFSDDDVALIFENFAQYLRNGREKF